MQESFEAPMENNNSEPIVVFLTAANGEEAARLADMLVGANLAACVQILPEIESVYRWQGGIERQAEILLIAKTSRSKFEDLDREVRALHSYDTPEIVAIPILAGSARYLRWLDESLNLLRATAAQG
jgi:periplasmic divalent cation tolerance protein